MPPGRRTRVPPEDLPERSRIGSVRGVEGRLRGVEGERPDELQSLRGTAEPVHAGVLPLDGDRTVVADRAQHPEAPLPGHVAVAGGHEVPATAGVGPGEVGAEAAVAAVAHRELRVLAVDVI